MLAQQCCVLLRAFARALSRSKFAYRYRFCFPNADHVTIPERFEPLVVFTKRLRANMKMSNFERGYSSGYHHMICIGKTKLTSEKGPLSSNKTGKKVVRDLDNNG